MKAYFIFCNTVYLNYVVAIVYNLFYEGLTRYVVISYFLSDMALQMILFSITIHLYYLADFNFKIDVHHESSDQRLLLIN